MANITGNIQTAVAGAITTGTADVFIQEQWATEALMAAEFAAVIRNRVDQHFRKYLRVGDTINVPRGSNLTANDKTPGTNAAFEAITETSQSITAALHKYAAFLVENLVEVQANQDLRAMYTKKVGYALARSIETNLSGIFDGLSTTVGTLGVELTTDDYLEAWQKLAEAGLLEQSPNPTDDFSIILAPASYADACKVEVFINRNYNPQANVVQGMALGDIYGFPVFVSNLLESDATGQHDCVMMSRGCFGLVVTQELKMESDHLIPEMGDGVIGSVVFGAAELNYPPETAGGGTAVDNRGVYLKTK